MKPDILVAYPPEEGFGPGAGSYAVVYVRPETNTVLYERAIVAGIRARGDTIIYTANLNGGLFESDGILKRHYVTQLAFAADPRGQLDTLPRNRGAPGQAFRPAGRPAAAGRRLPGRRAGLRPKSCSRPSCPPRTSWPAGDSSSSASAGRSWPIRACPPCCGATPPQANVFVVVVRSADGSPGFFAALNRAIYLEITSRAETPLVDGERLGGAPWSERVRRTYHLSRTHLMAMFDMADLVYLGEGRRLPLADTPLGRSLRADGILSDEQLLGLPSEPLRRVQGGSHRTLHYLPLAGEGQDLDWARDFLRRL